MNTEINLGTLRTDLLVNRMLMVMTVLVVTVGLIIVVLNQQQIVALNKTIDNQSIIMDRQVNIRKAIEEVHQQLDEIEKTLEER